MITEFHFIRPYWLLALIPAAVIFYLLLKNKLNQGNWSAVCDAELLPYILQTKNTHQRRWPLITGLFSCIISIFAIAGPSWEKISAPVFRNEAALVIALDLSRSMDATDIKPSRLIRARFKIADILKKRKDGQTALLVYAGDAFTVTPLTNDNATIASQLSALTTEIMPSQGSNTVLAIEKAVKLLKQSGFQTGDILLITDAVDFEAMLSKVKSLAHYRLSILGVGTPAGAPIKDPQGGFVKDAHGNIVVPKLNSRELSKIAVHGHGLYRMITTNDSDINAILDQLDNPKPQTAMDDNKLFMDQWNDNGPWLLLLVLPLVALNFRKGLLSVALVCILAHPQNSYALEWKNLWQTRDQQAQQDFNQGKYKEAGKLFKHPQWKATAQFKAGEFDQTLETLKQDQSSDGYYNKGNALAKLGKLKEAIQAYGESLKIDPHNEDAKYNKQLLEEQLKKQKQKQQKNNQQSKKKQSEQPNSDKKEQNQQNSNTDQANQQKQKHKQKKAQDQKNAKKSPEQQKSEQQNQAEQSKQQQIQKEHAQAKDKQIPKSKYDESKQAVEQWINRIPDDPAGLLRRKFKYQYNKRERKNNAKEAW